MPSRLYSDLAWVWPLLDDASGHARDFTDLIGDLVATSHDPSESTLLHLGSGAGRYDENFARSFRRVVGIDASERMVALAKASNEAIEYHVADIRSCDLSETFDCIFIDDALCYMVEVSDVNRTLATARRHLTPGGVVVFSLDAISDTIDRMSTSCLVARSSAKPADVEIAYMRSYYKPVVERPECVATFVFTIHDSTGSRVEYDQHTTAVHPLSFWRDVVTANGFRSSEHRGPEIPSEVIFCLR